MNGYECYFVSYFIIFHHSRREILKCYDHFSSCGVAMVKIGYLHKTTQGMHAELYVVAAMLDISPLATSVCYLITMTSACPWLKVLSLHAVEFMRCWTLLSCQCNQICPSVTNMKLCVQLWLMCGSSSLKPTRIKLVKVDVCNTKTKHSSSLSKFHQKLLFHSFME